MRLPGLETMSHHSDEGSVVPGNAVIKLPSHSNDRYSFARFRLVLGTRKLQKNHKVSRYQYGILNFELVLTYHVVRRIDDGERLCKDLIALVQERANIEKEFAKQLKQWSGKWNNLIEKGNCRVVGYSKYLLV